MSDTTIGLILVLLGVLLMFGAAQNWRIVTHPGKLLDRLFVELLPGPLFLHPGRVEPDVQVLVSGYGHEVFGYGDRKFLRPDDAVVFTGPEIVPEHVDILLRDLGKDVFALQVRTESLDDLLLFGRIDGGLGVPPEKDTNR